MNDILQTIEQAKADTDTHAASACEQEATRILTICNACRYCEGFCAVFPAMTQLLTFDKGDVHYLANLCHNCGACLHACQYAPPHEFAVNVPQTLAQVRVQTYADFAWPAPLGAAYQRNGRVVALALVGGLALFMLLVMWQQGGLIRADLGANFYAVFPHNFMAILFGSVFGFALLAMGIGGWRFWRALPSPSRPKAAEFGQAARNVLTLKYLDGNNNRQEALGCNNADDTPSHWRRRFHHLTFYGFMLCFASTTVATLYHYVWGWHAPYPYLSLPVILGTVGGLSMLVGTLGLSRLHDQRHPQHGDAAQKPMDQGFIALLFLTALTGLVLLGMRLSPFMPVLLAIHLGVVLALFFTLPYGKMVHGVYRGLALLKWAMRPTSTPSIAE